MAGRGKGESGLIRVLVRDVVAAQAARARECTVAMAFAAREFGTMPHCKRTLIRAVLALAVTAAPLAAQAPASRAPFTQLLSDHWQWSLRWNPVLATTLGERRHDRELGDLTVEAMDRRTREASAFLKRAEALKPSRLTPSERVSLAILRRSLTEQVEGNRFSQRTMLFTSYSSWHTGFSDLPDSHPFRERADYEAYISRLAAFPQYNRGGIATTRAAVAQGVVQPCTPFVGYESTMRDAVTASPDADRVRTRSSSTVPA